MGVENLAAFLDDIDRFEDAMVDEIVMAKRLLAEETLKKLASYSPVLTGTYVYNHGVSGSGISQMPVMYFPHTPGETMMEERLRKRETLGREMVMRESLKLLAMNVAAGKLVVDNHTPYANAIENGTSNFPLSAAYKLADSEMQTFADSVLARIPEKVI